MKADEEMGHDRGLEFETDDELNQGQHDDDDRSDALSSPTSSCSRSSSSRNGDNVYAGVEPSSYKTTWPQSYRQSIDVFSTLPSPHVGVGFLVNSSIAGTSFLKHSIFNKEEDTSDPIQPLLPTQSSTTYHIVSHDQIYHEENVIPDNTSLRFASYCELPPTQQCSTTQAIINGINVLCGVGILSTPYGVKEGGWLSLFLLVSMGFISCNTGMLLKRCIDSSPEIKTYPDIGHAAFGINGRIFISLILYLELYGSCVEYITLVADSLSSMFPQAHLSLMGIHPNAHQLFAFITTLAVLPTVWLKNLSLLSYLSAGGVIVTILVILCLFWVGIVDHVGFHRGGTALDLVNIPVSLGLYGFCFSGHAVFPNIYSSMKNPSDFPKALSICFGLCTILYAGVAIAGYSMFGDSIKSQFTLNLPQNYLSSKVAIWTTVINPMSKYALTLTPVALSIDELLPSSESQFLMLSIRTLLVISTLVVALTFPFFGLVMSLIGSVCTMLVALIFPCACYLSIKCKSLKLQEVFACSLIIFVGVACCIIGTYSSVAKMFEP